MRGTSLHSYKKALNYARECAIFPSLSTNMMTHSARFSPIFERQEKSFLSSSQLDERRTEFTIKRWMASIHRVCRGVVESLIKRIDVNDGDNKHEDRQILSIDCSSCHGWTLEFSSLGTFIRHVELLSIRKQINKR